MVTKGKDCRNLEGKTFQFIITSYNFMKDLRGPLETTVGPQVVVLDEAHMIKGSKASPSPMVNNSHRLPPDMPSYTCHIADMPAQCPEGYREVAWTHEHAHCLKSE